jgi:hypothetical protein
VGTDALRFSGVHRRASPSNTEIVSKSALIPDLFSPLTPSAQLTENLEKSKLSNPRLVVTASSVHDPDTPGGNIGSLAGLGDLAGT